MTFPYDVNDMTPNNQTVLVSKESVKAFADFITIFCPGAADIDPAKLDAWDALPEHERYEQQAAFFTAAALSSGWNRVERFGNEFVLWANVVHVK